MASTESTCEPSPVTCSTRSVVANNSSVSSSKFHDTVANLFAFPSPVFSSTTALAYPST